jgi:hypothetical protein
MELHRTLAGFDRATERAAIFGLRPNILGTDAFKVERMQEVKRNTFESGRTVARSGMGPRRSSLWGTDTVRRQRRTIATVDPAQPGSHPRRWTWPVSHSDTRREPHAAQHKFIERFPHSGCLQALHGVIERAHARRMA